MDSTSLLAIFQRSLLLLSRNPILLVPCVIGGFINVMLRLIFLVPPYAAAGIPSFTVNSITVHWIIYGLCASVVTVFAVVAVTSMAGSIWEQGSASILDGVRVLREAGSSLYQTLLQLAGIGILALILAAPTFGLAIIAAPCLMMYAISSAVIGRYPGFQAIRDSFAIATQRAKATITIVAVFLCLSISLQVIRPLFMLVPVLGRFVMLILNEAVIAYITLVVVGMYIRVRREEYLG